MRKVIIDCDPGHDDAVAILTIAAHPEEFEILGITCVAGNNAVEKVTRNALNIVEHFGLNVPVYMGCNRPLVKDPEPQPGAHGESGMDGPVFNYTNTFEELHAVEYMAETLKKEDKVTIFALGPLTNVAVLLDKYPELTSKIECIALMGGSVYGGNIQLRSEFNIYHDPEAARIVFDSNVPCIMAGLEVCAAGSVRLTDLERFKNGGKVYKFVDELMEFYTLYSKTRNLPSTTIFDVTPVIYLLRPEIFTSKQMDIKIELNGEFTRGMTICDENVHSNKTVLLDVENDKFVKVLFEALEMLDKKI